MWRLLGKKIFLNCLSRPCLITHNVLIHNVLCVFKYIESTMIFWLLIKILCTEKIIEHKILGVSQIYAKSEGRPCKNFSIKQGFYFREGLCKQPTSVAYLALLKCDNDWADTALVARPIKTVSFIKIFMKPWTFVSFSSS